MACSGSDTTESDDDDSNPTGSGGMAVGGGGGIGGGGAATGGSEMLCQPQTVVGCYTGPPGTEGVGLCVPGSQTCLPDGSAFGPCDGEVVPSDEVCATEGDDDCDGIPNEEGPDCSCNPGTTQSCYSGPPSTKDVGICNSGSQVCNNDGSGWGPCNGETLPQPVDDCNTSADEDCDGANDICPEAVVDLRADNNRNGVVELTSASEDANEHTWDATHGAVFLANLDDDQNACPTSGSDTALAGCDDAHDSYLNGTGDLADMARLETVPWPAAPTDSFGSITAASPGNNYVRFFIKSGNNWNLYVPGTLIPAADLQAGVEVAVEGLDIVRDDSVWNGFVDVTLQIVGGTGPNGPISGGTDAVRLRVAPLIFRHHLDPATQYYVTNFNSSASQAFRNDLASAAGAAGVGVTNVYESDQWTQDFFETAYMSMPASGGKHTIHVNVRSANYTGSLRTAGRVVYTDLRGPDVAGLTEYDAGHANYMDTLNSFGNLETIPPYTHNGQSWPLGRVLRGSTSTFYPDTAFDQLVASQNVQDLVYIDTSWLLVAHVDETLSFVKANTPRGWVMLVNDATLAQSMLQQQQQNGYGNTTMFAGKYWSGNSPAQTTINAVLADPDVMNESAWAAVKVDDQVLTIQQQTGITTAEMVAIPFLHWETSGWSVAYQPGTVNGIYLADNVFAAPEPHGPVINGADIFEQQMASALSSYGINVHWVEDWDLYHRLLGEVHCGTNATRAVPTSSHWWNTGL
jgi:protein-arginine deiminase